MENIINYKITKKNIVNYFSDFILSKIPSNEISIIEVADCNNFVVVKGKTTSKEILNLSEIRDEFIKNNESDIKFSNTIDLIEYDLDLKEVETLNCLFYNSSNLVMSNCELKSKENELEPLINQSKFPYGYSLKSGKDLYYYAKHITYNLQVKYIWETLEIKISRKNNEKEFEIYTNCEQEKDEKLKSAILDSFDFNFENFRLQYEKSDWLSKSIQPSDEFDFVSKINDKLIVF